MRYCLRLTKIALILGLLTLGSYYWLSRLHQQLVLAANPPPPSLFFSEYVAGTGDSFPQDTFAGLGSHTLTAPPLPLTVVINEVAWAGTQANPADEWLELHNPTTQTISLAGWSITSPTGISLTLTGLISPAAYYLIESGHDQVISPTPADLVADFAPGLPDEGTSLFLAAQGVVVDVVNADGGGWPGGTGNPAYHSMARLDPLAAGADENWVEQNIGLFSEQDAAGNPISGTPKQPNLLYTLPPPLPLALVINEVAWGGTAASSADEWLELLNTTTQTIPLAGWVITSTNGLTLPLTGSIDPNGYYLLERTDDSTVSDVPADLFLSFGSGLNNNGDTLFLSSQGVVIDTANADGGVWPGGSGSPDYTSMERTNALLPDTDSNWVSNNTLTRNGQDAASSPLNGTPRQPNSPLFPVPTPTPTPSPLPTPAPTPSAPLLISEFLYDGTTPSIEGDEFVELCNPNPTPLDVTGYKVGDEEVSGGGESMYQLPSLTLTVNGCLVVAKNADQFQARFGFLPDFELVVSGNNSDNPAIPNLSKYPTWGSGNWALSNDADEIVVLGGDDVVVDSIAFRNGDYEGLGLEASASAPEPRSLQRVWPVDTNSMPNDFVSTDPTPGVLTAPPPPPTASPPPAILPDGMYGFWGDLHAHTTHSDGVGPPYFALARARAAGLHFYAITDHDWWLTEEEWAKTLTQTLAATVPGEFVALRGLEWTPDSGGHINVFNTNTLIQSTNPMFADLSGFYTWLATQPEVIAQFNHPDPTYGGTFHDFAFHPAASQVIFLQEIGNHAQGYVSYEPSFIQSNTVGWRTAPTNNSDAHQADWGRGSAARTGIIAPALTEADLLAALRARRVFATEDSNLALALRAGRLWMGSVLTRTGLISLTVEVVDPDPEPLTLLVYDGNLPLATLLYPTSTTQWNLTVTALPGHFYWGKVVQADGDTAYSAPLWVEGQLSPAQIYLNEVLPAPREVDWNGNGTADHLDEWVELFNPTDQAVGLGGWRLGDTSQLVYHFPLELVIPPRGFVTIYQAESSFALNNGGDSLTLTRPDGSIADSFGYDHSPGYDGSWCRLPDGGSDWSDACEASPTAPNGRRIAAGPLKVNIFAAKRLAYNAWVEVKGQVTAPPGVLGPRTMYIQDETAGIMIYLPKDHRLTLNLGDKVAVLGHVRSFYEEAEIVVAERGEVDFIRAGPALPPLPIATTSLLEPYEGLLVQLQGQAVNFQGRTMMWVDDGTGWAATTIRPSTGIKKPFIKVGTPLTTLGIVSQYSPASPTRADYRLLLRYQSDLILPAPTPSSPPDPPAADWPAFLPETGN